MGLFGFTSFVNGSIVFQFAVEGEPSVCVKMKAGSEAVVPGCVCYAHMSMSFSFCPRLDMARIWDHVNADPHLANWCQACGNIRVHLSHGHLFLVLHKMP